MGLAARKLRMVAPPAGFVGSRTFDGSDDEIGLDVGTSTGALTAYTIGGLYYPDAARSEYLCSVGTSSNTAIWECGRLSSGAFWIWTGSTYREWASALPVDTWRIWMLSKAAGTATPRLHLYNFDTSSWSHTDASGTAPDSGSPGSGGRWWLADYPSAGQPHLTGHISVHAVWRSALSNANVETLSDGLAAWGALSPIHLWVLDQADVSTSVLDDGSAGGDQTSRVGTTVGPESPLGA